MWVKYKRPFDEGEWSVKNVKTYGTKWWKWYKAVQPFWRTRTGIEPLPRKDSSNEGFADVCIAGPSGLFQLVGSLFLWRTAIQHPSADYLKAVDEVAWLLKEVNVAMENDDLEVKVAGGGTKQRPAKRRKVR